MHVAYPETIFFLISNSGFFKKIFHISFIINIKKYLILVYFLDNASADC